MMRKDKDIKAIRVKLIGQRQATISTIVGCPNVKIPKRNRKRYYGTTYRKTFPEIKKELNIQMENETLCQQNGSRIMDVETH